MRNMSNICNDLENISHHTADTKARRETPMTTTIIGEEWFGRVYWPRLESPEQENPEAMLPHLLDADEFHKTRSYRKSRQRKQRR